MGLPIMDYEAFYRFEGLGYRRDLEDLVSLEEGAKPSSELLYGDTDPRNLGKPIGVQDWMKIENQVRLNSCAGNSVTSIAEACVYYATGGQCTEHLSRMFAYINGQKFSNIQGDSGATLWGVMEGLKKDGLCLESLAPYTGSYYTQFKREAHEEAKKRLLQSWVTVTSVAQVYEGLAKRIGGLFLGSQWTPNRSNLPADNTVRSFQEQRGCGYHATCILDWCEEKDDNGLPLLREFNSHSEAYGDKGTAKWTEKALQQCFAFPNTTAFFISDMEIIKPRFDYSKAKWTSV